MRSALRLSLIHRRSPLHGRRRLAATASVASVILALAFPMNALAWTQYYSWYTTFGAGGFQLLRLELGAYVE